MGGGEKDSRTLQSPFSGFLDSASRRPWLPSARQGLGLLGRKTGCETAQKKDSPWSLTEMCSLLRKASVESHRLDVTMLKITSARLRM